MFLIQKYFKLELLSQDGSTSPTLTNRNRLQKSDAIGPLGHVASLNPACRRSVGGARLRNLPLLQ